MKWKGLTPDGLERLRQAALKNRPWERSTGPRTPEGKARSASNGKALQVGPLSVMEVRAEMTRLRALAHDMREARKLVGV